MDNHVNKALSLFFIADMTPITKPITPKPAMNGVGKGNLIGTAGSANFKAMHTIKVSVKPAAHLPAVALGHSRIFIIHSSLFLLSKTHPLFAAFRRSRVSGYRKERRGCAAVFGHSVFRCAKSASVGPHSSPHSSALSIRLSRFNDFQLRIKPLHRRYLQLTATVVWLTAAYYRGLVAVSILPK